MTVPTKIVDRAYRFFLGRGVRKDQPPKFQNYGDLVETLLGSAEFKASSRSKKFSHGWPIAQVFLSKDARVIYCPIGKNACTFLKRQIVRISNVEFQDFLLPDIHRLTDHTNTGLQLSDYPREEIESLIGDPEYFRFAVLRHPEERLLSAYTDKFIKNREDPAHIQHTRSVVQPVQLSEGLPELDYRRGITFRAFIEFITSQEPGTLDPHWKPQKLYLTGISWDHFYMMDEINALVSDLERRTGKKLPRRSENTTASGHGDAHPGAMDLLPTEIETLPAIGKASFWDDHLQGLVREFFAEDYSLCARTLVGSTP